ncbi:MAG: glycosyltransferase family 39 protein [Planctomycetota bacterium]
MSERGGTTGAGWAVGVILLAWAAVFAVKALGPVDLVDNDQKRPASYVLDLLRNGEWLVQHDWAGSVVSKPPFHVWIASVATAAFPRAETLALSLPSAFAVLAIALMVAAAGGRVFGVRAGLLGALAWLLSSYGLKHLTLVRTDALYAALTFAGFLLALRAAAVARRGRTLPWLAHALATLTKGPAAPAFALAGLALPRRWIWGRRRVASRIFTVRGLLLLVLLVGGWFLAAWFQVGDALVDKMLGRELVGHAVADGQGKGPLQTPHVPLFYFVTRFIPWSPLALLAIWRVLRRPAAGHLARVLERACVAFFAVGLIVFSIAPHQRADLLLPLVPPMAILVGRELDRMTGRWGSRGFAFAVVGVVAAAVAFSAFWFLGPRADSKAVRRNARLIAAAEDIEARFGFQAPLEHTTASYALQWELDTARRTLDEDELVARFRAGPVRAAVQAEGLARLRRELGPEGFEILYADASPSANWVVATPGYRSPADGRAAPEMGIRHWLLAGLLLIGPPLLLAGLARRGLRATAAREGARRSTPRA